MAYNFPYRIPLIKKSTASSSTSIAFTSGISSNFSVYLVKIRTLVAATNTANLLLTFSVDGGSNYLATNYKWGKLLLLGTGPTRTYSNSASDTSIIVTTNVSSTSANDLNGDILLYNLNTANIPTCMFHSTCYNGTATPLSQTVMGGGMNTTTGSVNAIKFAMSSGNIASGTIYLYGIQDGGFLY